MWNCFADVAKIEAIGYYYDEKHRHYHEGKIQQDKAELDMNILGWEELAVSAADDNDTFIGFGSNGALTQDSIKKVFDLTAGPMMNQYNDMGSEAINIFYEKSTASIPANSLITPEHSQMSVDELVHGDQFIQKFLQKLGKDKVTIFANFDKEDGNGIDCSLQFPSSLGRKRRSK